MAESAKEEYLASRRVGGGKINGLEPKKWRWMEDEFPVENCVFFKGFHVHFLGCIETHGHGVSVGLSV